MKKYLFGLSQSVLVLVWTLIPNHPRYGLVVLLYSPSKNKGETKWPPRPLCLQGNSLCKMSFLPSSRRWLNLGSCFSQIFSVLFPHFLSFGITAGTKLHTGNSEGPTEWPAAAPVVPTAATSRLKKKYLTKNTVAFTEMIFFFFWWLSQLGRSGRSFKKQTLQQPHLICRQLYLLRASSELGRLGTITLQSLISPKGAVFPWTQKEKKKAFLAQGALGRCCRGRDVESPSRSKPAARCQILALPLDGRWWC